MFKVNNWGLMSDFNQTKVKKSDVVSVMLLVWPPTFRVLTHLCQVHVWLMMSHLWPAEHNNCVWLQIKQKAVGSTESGSVKDSWCNTGVTAVQTITNSTIIPLRRLLGVFLPEHAQSSRRIRTRELFLCSFKKLMFIFRKSPVVKVQLKVSLQRQSLHTMH